VRFGHGPTILSAAATRSTTGPNASALGRPIAKDHDSLTFVERPELAIAVQRTDSEAVVNLAGEIDMLTVQRLSTTVNEMLADPPPRIVLDLSGVTFCDSQGLGTLVVLSRKATTAQTVLVLTNVADFLMRVLDITGLRSALMIRNGQ
jgi:anti-anti-sigma factor